MNYDIFLVGVGGQGVLTIGDIITETALKQDIPASFYPTKGMAQRGGFVKAQLRLGRALVGPTIPERGADLVIAMELSESLKAVRYVRPGGDFLLYGHVWPPTAVMLGKADYPELGTVVEQIETAEAQLHYLSPHDLPRHDGQPVAPNVFVLGAALALTGLSQVLDPDAVADVVEHKWRRGIERNMTAFRGGLEMEPKGVAA
jgi:indolepyruvate ferredoxin oxidoreductase beta subunit